MFMIKKKLSSLIPTEGTRDVLQNVLTVEWSGHKTVLVEVPEVGSNRSNEVEMSGISNTNRSQYGRLADDDTVGSPWQQDSSPNHFDKPFNLPPPLPPKPTSSSSSAVSNPPFRLKSNNPFASKYKVDDYEVQNQARVAERFAPSSSSRRQLEDDEFQYRPPKVDTTRSAGPKDSQDPWSRDIWDMGVEDSPTSSNSSKDTRRLTSSTENPFGN